MLIIFKLIRDIIAGNNKISSISKIKKIKAKIKNRIEKGKRPSFKVANPHSKGDKNSRL